MTASSHIDRAQPQRHWTAILNVTGPLFSTSLDRSSQRPWTAVFAVSQRPWTAVLPLFRHFSAQNVRFRRLCGCSSPPNMPDPSPTTRSEPCNTPLQREKSFLRVRGPLGETRLSTSSTRYPGCSTALRTDPHASVPTVRRSELAVHSTGVYREVYGQVCLLREVCWARVVPRLLSGVRHRQHRSSSSSSVITPFRQNAQKGLLLASSPVKTEKREKSMEKRLFCCFCFSSLLQEEIGGVPVRFAFINNSVPRKEMNRQLRTTKDSGALPAPCSITAPCCISAPCCITAPCINLPRPASIKGALTHKNGVLTHKTALVLIKRR